MYALGAVFGTGSAGHPAFFGSSDVVSATPDEPGGRPGIAGAVVSRLVSKSSMASRIFASHSACVAPLLTQPGRSATQAAAETAGAPHGHCMTRIMQTDGLKGSVANSE